MWVSAGTIAAAAERATQKANASPTLLFDFAARVTPFPFSVPERRGNGAPGGARGLRGPLRALREPVPRADQGRFARPALGRAPPSAKGAAPPGAPPTEPGLFARYRPRKVWA